VKGVSVKCTKVRTTCWLQNYVSNKNNYSPHGVLLRGQSYQTIAYCSPHYVFKYKRITFANAPFLGRCSILLSKVNSKHKLQRIHLLACFLSLDKLLIHNILSPSPVRMSKLPRTKLCYIVFFRHT
jgi:hypothetical protein